MDEKNEETSEKKVMIAAHLLPYLAKKIKADAEKQDRSVSWTVNDILTKWYENKGGGKK
jgi:hypothetical protein